MRERRPVGTLEKWTRRKTEAQRRNGRDGGLGGEMRNGERETGRRQGRWVGWVLWRQEKGVGGRGGELESA